MGSTVSVGLLFSKSDLREGGKQDGAGDSGVIVQLWSEGSRRRHWVSCTAYMMRISCVCLHRGLAVQPRRNLRDHEDCTSTALDDMQYIVQAKERAQRQWAFVKH